MRRHDNDERGVTAVEYALLIALISVVIMFAVPGLGSNLSSVLGKTIPALGGVTQTTPPDDNNPTATCDDNANYLGDVSKLYWLEWDYYDTGHTYKDATGTVWMSDEPDVSFDGATFINSSFKVSTNNNGGFQQATVPDGGTLAMMRDLCNAHF